MTTTKTYSVYCSFQLENKESECPTTLHVSFDVCAMDLEHAITVSQEYFGPLGMNNSGSPLEDFELNCIIEENWPGLR